jgi:hypothetical protein
MFKREFIPYIYTLIVLHPVAFYVLEPGTLDFPRRQPLSQSVNINQYHVFHVQYFTLEVRNIIDWVVWLIALGL